VLSSSVHLLVPILLQVSGSKFYYLRNAAALLELALLNWAYSRVAAKGFTMLATPDLVRMDVLEKCGFQPRMENTQVGPVNGGAVGFSRGMETHSGRLWLGFEGRVESCSRIGAQCVVDGDGGGVHSSLGAHGNWPRSDQ
jgi:hypothetical protein